MMKKYIIGVVFLLVTSVITAQEFKIGKLKKEHFEISLIANRMLHPQFSCINIETHILNTVTT